MRFSCLLAFLVSCVAPAFAAGTFSIDNYQLVSSQRVTVTKYNVTYSASLMNTGAAQPAVSATLTSLDPSIQVVPGHDTLNFAPVPANSQTPSSNTFTILVDRSLNIDFSKLQWTFQSAPAPPVANAGQNQKAAIGSTVTLDGSASTNPSGVGMLTYSFSFASKPAGSNATLMNANTVSPTFVVDVAGNYVVNLTVSNGVASSTASVTISTVSTPPIANAGPNQTVVQGSTVTLDGSKSTDPDGNPLTFAFTLTSRPAGSTATLMNANTASPTFVADKAGTYIAQLVVTDKNGSSTNQAFVTITTTANNTPPVANAGPNQSVKVGSTVQLDGSGSTDVNGNPLTYQFKFNSVPAGSNAVLSNPTAVNPTFVADQPGTYVVQLIVNDGVNSSAPSIVTITTNTIQAPTANAGPNQMVSVNTVVTLNGSGTDPQQLPLTFMFALTTKPANSNATLTNPNTANPTFIPDLPGQYIAQLTVSNGFKTATSTVNITTTAPAPVANAGQNQTVTAGSTVTLDGSASSDANHFPLTYSFVLLSKPANSNAALNGATTVSPTFVADQPGMYVVQLIVNNGFSPSQPVTVTINAVSGNPGSVTPTGGTPQSTAVGTAFGSPLAVTVKDANGFPVSGVTVTFTVPNSGAGATFAGNANTAVTNASGVATSAALTANNTAGNFTITATVPNVGTPANFSLTNTPGAATAITATSGTPQTTAAGTAFAAPLVATVKDSLGNPVSGVTVTFTAPATGAGGTFAGGVNTAVTDASGNATSAVFTANNTAGAFTVSASAPGVASPATFSLTSTSGGAASVTATGGTPQTAPINTAFANPLSVTVKDSGGNPVSGVTVTFTAPATGASGVFAGGNTAVTNASGVATSGVFTANSTIGTYTVNATAPGVTTPAAFTLTNISGPAASITATGGTPQSASTNAAFASPLTATVKDAGGNPVAGVTVTFNAPAGGASGTFAGGNTAVTNASGVATSSVFTANGTAGSYTVSATAPGVATPATFSLTNNAPPPASITASGGSGQSANINTAFASPLSATVLDAQQHPVAGVTVTFAAPGSGASGTFAAGNTAITNASGVATSSTFTANGTAGAYTVTASVPGVATPASFSLTNTSVVQTGPPIAVTGGAVGQNLQIPITVTLGGPAPSGSVSITITSSDPANLLVSGRAAGVGAGSVTVTTVAGTASTTIFAQALGSNANVQVTATAAGYMDGTATVAVTPSGFTLAGPNGVGTSFQTNQGATTQLTVSATRLDSSLNPTADTQPLRAGFSTTVPITVSDMNIATVQNPSLNFTAGTTSLTTQLVASSTGMGNVTVTAGEPGTFQAPAGGGNTLLVTVQPSGITCANTSVGNNLETTVNCTLQGAAPSGGLTVNVTSNDPNKLLLSTDPTALGTGSLALVIPSGLTRTQDFFVQGLAGSGTVTYTAMANGFGTSTGTVTLTPSGFTLAGPGGGQTFIANTGAGGTEIDLFSVQLDNSGTVQNNQQIRGGFSATVNIASSMPSVGTVTPASVTFAGGDFSAMSQFNPLSSGNTDLTATPQTAGFSIPAGGLNVVTAKVSTPQIRLTDSGTIGKNLETSGSLLIPQQAPPGGQVVTFTSNNPSLLISASPDTLGSTTAMITVPAGKNNVKYFLQSLTDTGTASYTASSSGFQSSTSTVTLTPSGVEISGPQGPGSTAPTTVKVSSGPVDLLVDLVQVDSNGNVLGQGGETLIPGMTIQVNLTSSVPGVGTVTPAQVTITGGSASSSGNPNAQFNPKGTGSTVVSIVSQPAGYTAPPPAFTTVKFNVTP